MGLHVKVEASLGYIQVKFEASLGYIHEPQEEMERLYSPLSRWMTELHEHTDYAAWCWHGGGGRQFVVGADRGNHSPLQPMWKTFGKIQRLNNAQPGSMTQAWSPSRSGS